MKYFCTPPEKCDLCMTDRGKTYWDRVGDSWDICSQRLWRIHSDTVNRALLDRWLPEGRVESLLKTDLFDEMCSDGLYPFLKSCTRNFVGIDVSPATLLIARLRYGKLKTVAADVRRLPFADGSFDLIVSNSTLDHFESPTEIDISLTELNRVLRTGGYLFITMDNPTNPIVALRNALSFRFLNRLGVVPYYVGATLNMQELKLLLEGMGFEILDAQTIMHCPRVFAVALARLLDRYATPWMQRVFLRIMMIHEVLALLPTHRLTGYFTAVRAVKRVITPG